MRLAVPLLAVPLLLSTACATVGRLGSSPEVVVDRRPFGTLREQAERQQAWLRERIQRQIPMLMRREKVEMWIVSMRESNEDPVFRALAGPRTFSTRRRTVYVFFDRGLEGIERLTLNGTSEAGLFDMVRSRRRVDLGISRPEAELLGPELWQLLRELVTARNPRTIAINVSHAQALADGLTHTEHEALVEALGPALAQRLVPAESLAVELLSWRSREEDPILEQLSQHAGALLERALSSEVITPGKTRTSDVAWWLRQQAEDLGLGTWMHPSVDVQRRGVTEAQMGEDPIIERGDVLHASLGLEAMRLHSEVRRPAYVLREGEKDAPWGLNDIFRRQQKLQTWMAEELLPGRKGNDILRYMRARMTHESVSGIVTAHPIGLHGFGAGPVIGLWDTQDGVPGSGDARVIAGNWYAAELLATSKVREWGNQPVYVAQTEGLIIESGTLTARWAREPAKGFLLVR
ncbi:Xaa-Pro aminopeptidase [Myxococcaceae bacterium GXIMD 01537]